jgi:hypothetical protein
MKMTEDGRPNPEQDFIDLEEKYKDRLPQNWEEMGRYAKLEWFAHRILLDLREETGREGSKDWGFLSDYQLERRRRREVQSKLNGWDDIPPRQGVFRRVYVDQNRLLINREDGNQNGQKNP